MNTISKKHKLSKREIASLEGISEEMTWRGDDLVRCSERIKDLQAAVIADDAPAFYGGDDEATWDDVFDEVEGLLRDEVGGLGRLINHVMTFQSSLDEIASRR